ncbi:MAG: hypothetical protein IME93_06950 [Proteobacteria bacterium]|nr:hypothetical protein [Pseudomonadota bacterium]
MSNTIKLWLKLGTMLVSTVFFIFSCTATVMTGSRVLPTLDARHIDTGDEPHDLFYVLAVSKKDKGEIKIILLSEVKEKLASKSPVTFLLPVASGVSKNFSGNKEITKGIMEYKYSVEQTGTNEQMVSLDVTDRKKMSGKYRYKVTGSEIVPIYSRLSHFTYTGIMALVIALLFSLILHVIGRLLVSRYKQPQDA